MQHISIVINEIELKATLLETPTAQAVYDALPFDGQAQVWGDEIYFDIPVGMEQEADAKEEVEVGDLAFWPIGQAFCIFFGRTPVSTSEKPRAFSPVNVFGKIEGNVEALRIVAPQSLVKVRKLI